MSFDIRVNNGRCPPFLLGGCILLCVILICNWWSYSSQNYDLLRQIGVLEEQMRICCGDRDQCTNDRNKLENNVGELKIRMDQQNKENKKDRDRVEKELTLCKTELDSLKNLDTSKTESLNALRTTLEEKKEEIKLLKEQAQQLTQFKEETLKRQQKGNDEADDNPTNNRENDAANETTEGNREGVRDYLFIKNSQEEAI